MHWIVLRPSVRVREIIQQIAQANEQTSVQPEWKLAFEPVLMTTAHAGVSAGNLAFIEWERRDW